MRTFCWPFLLGAFLLCGGARADSGDDALVEKGLQLRRERRDGEALEFFRQAHDARPAPRTLAQIALAEQALGQWVDAERDLRRALHAGDDPWIVSHRETLARALEAIGEHLGTLIVKANTPNGQVWLNGTNVGDLSVESMRVPAGALRVEVRAAGHVPALQSVEIASGATVTAAFQLVDTPEPAKSAPETKDTQSASRNGTSAAAIVPASRSGTAPDTTRRGFAWGMLGAAGAFLGGAVGAQIIHEQKASQFNDDARCLYGALSRDQRCGVYRGQAEFAQKVANVGYIAAGALGIASAVLFLIPTQPKASGVHLWFDVGASGAKLTFGGKL